MRGVSQFLQPSLIVALLSAQCGASQDPVGKRSSLSLVSMQEGPCSGATLQLIPSGQEFLVYAFLDDFSSTSISHALFSL